MDTQLITPSIARHHQGQTPDNSTVENLVATLRCHDIIGRSKAFLDLVRLIPSVAARGMTTLILGETGTGKGVLARALHYLGPRSGGPFVPVHCSSLSPDLMENELFGHTRGSFTGADSTTAGLVASAWGGVLFLDDIDLLPLASQGKILQLLEEGEYRRLGSREFTRSDIWIISASNTDLKREVDERRFRADLYYRIAGMTLRVPPLRERQEDIPLLVEHFLSLVDGAGGEKGTQFSSEDLGRIIAYDWPGNIRELKSFVERYAALPPGEAMADWMQLGGLRARGEENHLSLHEAESRVIDAVRLEHVRRAIAEAEGNIAEASRILGLHRSEVYRICKKYRIPH